MKQTILSLILTTLPSLPLYAEAPSEQAINTDNQKLSLTIYNDNLALVRDERNVALKAGVNTLAWKEVSAYIQAESALLNSHHAPISLLEQNFDYDLLNESALLDKFVGKELEVIHQNPATGEEVREKATVLANNNGIILRYQDRIESALPNHARLAFPSIPEQLRDRPTLTIDLHSDQATTQPLSLHYLSTGFHWKADYVATLSPDDKHLNLAGWVTVNNNSGINYENAQLQLVAGEVNRAPQMIEPRMMLEMMAAPVAAAPKSALEEESLFEYHLYTLPRPTTLKNNQQKQLALLSASQIPVQKTYRITGNHQGYYQNQSSDEGLERDVEVFVSFDNKEPLGKALPAGIVRVYKQDSQQNTQLIGEDRIKHTPKNETIRLKMGNAFDIKANWKLLESERLNKTILHHEARKVKVAIELRNQKEEDVIVEILEPMGENWTIESESHPHQKASAYDARWDIAVPAGQTVVLEYQATIRY